MTQPVTLFTGQWVDLPLDEVASIARGRGYGGMEIACSGEHLDVQLAAHDGSYVKNLAELLKRHDLGVTALPASGLAPPGRDLRWNGAGCDGKNSVLPSQYDTRIRC